MAHTSATNLSQSTTPTRLGPNRAKSKERIFFFRSQIEISPRPPSRRLPPRPAAAAAAAKRSIDGVGVVLHALRRQPLGGGHLGRHGGALRGHLLAPHLPHRHLQLPPRHHRAPLPQARRHEGRRLLLLLLLLRRLRILPALGLLLVAGQEDGPRRDKPQGRRAGAIARQAQVRRRRGRRALRRLRPAQFALRGTRRRQAALRAGPARPAHEPPRHPRERPHRLLHGLPLLPLLHQHPHQPAEAARLRATPRGGRGRRGPLPHARSESKLSFHAHPRDGVDFGMDFRLREE